MSRQVTFDELAAERLLSGKPLDDLIAVSEVWLGNRCPECDGENTISGGDGYNYACSDCDIQYDLRDYRLVEYDGVLEVESY